MKRTTAIIVILFATLATLAAQQPNIIFMVADDLGYGDLSSYNPNAEGTAPNNTPIRTPHLDQMAQRGRAVYRCALRRTDLLALAAGDFDGALPEPSGGVGGGLS